MIFTNNMEREFSAHNIYIKFVEYNKIRRYDSMMRSLAHVMLIVIILVEIALVSANLRNSNKFQKNVKDRSNIDTHSMGGMVVSSYDSILLCLCRAC